MDINATKYKRLLDHLADEGSTDFNSLFKVLKMKKPELMAEYLQKAIDEDDEDASILATFQDSLEDTPQVKASPKAPAAEAPSEDVSAPTTGPVETSPDRQLAEETGEVRYQLKGSNGQVTALHVVVAKGNRVILAEQPKADVINLVIGGNVHPVDLTGIKAGASVTVEGKAYTGAAILAAAELAR